MQKPVADSIAEGTYDLYLHMPDPYASLAGDPRYAVRLANHNMWNAMTGMNNLGASITIVESGAGIEDVQRTKDVQREKVQCTRNTS